MSDVSCKITNLNMIYSISEICLIAYKYDLTIFKESFIEYVSENEKLKCF